MHTSNLQKKQILTKDIFQKINELVEKYESSGIPEGVNVIVSIPFVSNPKPEKWAKINLKISINE